MSTTRTPPAAGDEPTAAEIDQFDSLRRVAEEHGYLVTVWPGDEPHAKGVEVSHEAQTISVFEDAPVAETLRRLRAVVDTLRSADRPT